MINREINFINNFGDTRLGKRANRFLGLITKHQKVAINSISKDWAEAIDNYRMLENEKVTLEDITAGIINNCSKNAQCSHALVFQDTTQPSYEKNRERIKPGSGLGEIGDNKSLGYFMHPSLVVDADKMTCFGFSDIKVWIREEGREKYTDKEKRKSLPIEEKESYRWLESINKSKERLPLCERFTSIADRESDMYELFANVPDEKTDLLIRSKGNKRIKEGKLYEYLSKQKATGEYEIEIEPDKRKNREKRKAKIEIRFTKIHLIKPKRRKEKKYPAEIELFAVEAREKPETVPSGEKPILWRILTTHYVGNFAQAAKIVKWYSLRWYIEELFRVIKKKGLDIESSELKNGKSIIKLGLFALASALKLMQVLLAIRNNDEQPIDIAFTKHEQKYLKKISKQYKGRTDKQKNLFKEGTLNWAAWIIARIGGWKGYGSQRKAGPITMYEGLVKFHIQ
jgi:hypothetical protein